MSTTSDTLEDRKARSGAYGKDIEYLAKIAFNTGRIADELEKHNKWTSPRPAVDPVTAMAVAAEHGGGTMIADVTTYPDGRQTAHAVATWEDPDEAR